MKTEEWVDLTLEQKHYLDDVLNLQGRYAIIDTIAAKLKELNTQPQGESK